MRLRILALLLLCLVPLSCAKSPAEQLILHKSRGAAYVKDGKLSEAVLEFRNAVLLAPQDTDTLFQLGDTYLQQGKPKDAYAAFQKVVELDPKHLDAQLRLGNLFLLANSPDEAKKKAEQVIADAPSRADAYFLLGKAFLKERDLDGALKQFAEALRIDPKNLHYLSMKATAFLLFQRLPEARQVVDTMLPIAPTNGGTLLLLAQVADLQGEDATVQQAFDKLLKTEPKNPIGWLAYGNYWVKKGQPAKAIDAYQKASEVDPEGTAGLERIAELTLSSNDLEATRRAVAALLKNNPHSLSGKYYQARVHLGEKQFDDAIAQLQEVVKERPQHPQAHFYLGMAHYGQGSFLTAKTELRRAVELDPAFGKARVLLAQVYLDTKDYEQAVQTTDPLFQEGAQVPGEAVLIRAYGLLGQGKVKDARALFEKALEASPGNPRTLEGLALCYQAEKNPEKALDALQQALKADPTNPHPLLLATQILVSSGKTDQAVKLVADHIANTGETASARALLGRLYAARGKANDTDRAEKELTRAMELDSKAVDTYYIYAKLKGDASDYREGLTAVDKAVQAKPQQPLGWVLKGKLHDLMGETEAANTAYRKALAIDPAYADALNNLAWNLSEHAGNLDEALKFAEKAVEQAPNDPAANDTLGWIYLKKGVALSALSHLEIAAKGLTDNPAVHYHLGKAYAEQGEKAKAAGSLKQALRLSKTFPGAKDAEKLLGEME